MFIFYIEDSVVKLELWDTNKNKIIIKQAVKIKKKIDTTLEEYLAREYKLGGKVFTACILSPYSQWLLKDWIKHFHFLNFILTTTPMKCCNQVFLPLLT